MQYKSLIRIFEYCGIDCGDVDVVKAKKALSAEFAIAPCGFITIDGFDYYMLFEKKDTLTSIKILIMNNGSDTLHIYASEGKFKFTVAPSNMLWIEGSTNAIDLLHFPQINPSGALLTSTSVLISDNTDIGKTVKQEQEEWL